MPGVGIREKRFPLNREWTLMHANVRRIQVHGRFVMVFFSQRHEGTEIW